MLCKQVEVVVKNDPSLPLMSYRQCPWRKLSEVYKEREREREREEEGFFSEIPSFRPY